MSVKYSNLFVFVVSIVVSKMVGFMGSFLDLKSPRSPETKARGRSSRWFTVKYN